MLPVLFLSLALVAPEASPPPPTPPISRAAKLRPPLPPPFPRSLHDEAVGLLMARFDIDGDGRLDETEAAAVRQLAADLFARKKKAILDRYDRNGDGQLDAEEEARLKSDWEREHPGIGCRVRIKMVRLRRAQRTEFFSRFDVDHDGTLNEAERRALHEWVKNHRKEAHTPGDNEGHASRETPREGPAPANLPATATGPERRGPQPGSGRRRTWETLGIPPEAGIVLEYLLLQRYDANHDGVISAEEIERARTHPQGPADDRRENAPRDPARIET